MAEAPVEPARPLREIFGWRFWLNYLVCLVVTLWIPFVRIQMEVNGVLQGKPQDKPLYSIYQELWQHPDMWIIWKYVLLHWGITFAVMALVWWVVLRRASAPAGETHGQR